MTSTGRIFAALLVSLLSAGSGHAADRAAEPAGSRAPVPPPEESFGSWGISFLLCMQQVKSGPAVSRPPGLPRQESFGGWGHDFLLCMQQVK